MRIVIHDYAGHPFPVSLSRELASRGHEVAHVFASSLQTPRGDLTHRESDPPTLSFQELPMDPDYVRYKYSFLKRRSMEVAYGKKVAAFIRGWKPDAVISGNTPTETQASIVKATVNSGGRFYYWLQDFYSLAVDKLLRKKLPVIGRPIGAWYRRLDRHQFETSERIIAITEDFAPLLAREFSISPDRVAVIPNWALIEEIPALSKDNPWSRKHGLDDKFVFLYSGTIGMKHNPALLLELARHHAGNPNVRVVVVSEGIGSEWLRENAASAGLNNLVLLPYQPFRDLPSVLATGDVLTGILEPDAGTFSVPSKTLSYLCAKRPLLLAMPEDNLAARIARGNGAAFIVDPHDIPGFISAAERLYQSPKIRSELGGNARRYAEKTFPISGTAGIFEDLLQAG